MIASEFSNINRDKVKEEVERSNVVHNANAMRAMDTCDACLLRVFSLGALSPSDVFNPCKFTVHLNGNGNLIPEKCPSLLHLFSPLYLYHTSKGYLRTSSINCFKIIRPQERILVFEVPCKQQPWRE